MQTETAIAIYAFVTFFLLVSIIAIVRWGRTLETRLILLGLFAAIAAVWYGAFAPTGTSVGFQATGAGLPAGGRVETFVGVAGVAMSLMRIAVLLVLGGVAVALIARWNAAPLTEAREEVPHVP